MRTITIDCTGVRTEAEFWERYVAGTGAEGAAQFGRNLDAFADALYGGPGWPDECELQFTNTSAMSHAGASQFVEGLRAVAARSTHVKVTIT